MIFMHVKIFSFVEVIILEKVNRKGTFVGGYLREELREKLIAVQRYLSDREPYREPTITDALNFIISNFEIDSIPKAETLEGI